MGDQLLEWLKANKSRIDFYPPGSGVVSFFSMGREWCVEYWSKHKNSSGMFQSENFDEVLAMVIEKLIDPL